MRKRQFHDAVNLSAVPSHCVQGDAASIVWPVVRGRGGIRCPALSFRREAVGLRTRNLDPESRHGSSCREFPLRNRHGDDRLRFVTARVGNDPEPVTRPARGGSRQRRTAVKAIVRRRDRLRDAGLFGVARKSVALIAGRLCLCVENGFGMSTRAVPRCVGRTGAIRRACWTRQDLSACRTTDRQSQRGRHRPRHRLWNKCEHT
jgi:hypothetical protein